MARNCLRVLIFADLSRSAKKRFRKKSVAKFFKSASPQVVILQVDLLLLLHLFVSVLLVRVFREPIILLDLT